MKCVEIKRVGSSLKIEIIHNYEASKLNFKLVSYEKNFKQFNYKTITWKFTLQYNLFKKNHILQIIQSRLRDREFGDIPVVPRLKGPNFFILSSMLTSFGYSLIF